VVNIFQTSYESRLKSWHDLKQRIIDADIQTKCVETDKFWQAAPLVGHYLHPHDIRNWPGPWELIAENNYCEIARGLGMIYTLLLLGIEDIDFCLALNDNKEDVVIVVVDHAKYVLNYWPDTVLNNKLNDFTITHTIDISTLKTKIQ
jgi:hypothetical protein